MGGFGRKQASRQTRTQWTAQRDMQRQSRAFQPKRRLGNTFLMPGVTLTLFMAVAAMLMTDRDRWNDFVQPSASGLIALYNPAPDNVRRVPKSSVPDHGLRVAPRSMPICGSGIRRNCVVDGDTFWLDGEKIRIEGIDVPEVKGKCRHERDLAAKATKRLSTLLSQRSLDIDRNGSDRFGRTLVQVGTGRGEVGGALIREGLAREHAGGRRSWCD